MKKPSKQKSLKNPRVLAVGNAALAGLRKLLPSDWLDWTPDRVWK